MERGIFGDVLGSPDSGNLLNFTFLQGKCTGSRGLRSFLSSVYKRLMLRSATTKRTTLLLYEFQ